MREPRQHPGEVEAAEAGHLHVHEDRVDLLLVEHPQGRLPRPGRHDLADALVPAEQPGQLVEGRRLVVDGEHAQQR